ncbi:MAG: hypothetical protein R8G66_07525 [Cytophagales bacterium]|nr:hypothetical protein [Cytophagales bacterium]
MRQILISFLTMLLFLDLSGQIRLEPADSVDNTDWFKENPWGLMVTASVISDPSFNLNYNEMYDFLDAQGLDIDRDLELMQFGLQIRRNRFLWDAVTARDVRLFSEEEFTIGGRDVTVEQSYRSWSTSLGYVVFSNRRISIVPRAGLGIVRYAVQYTFDTSTSFDFSDPNSFSIEGSPELFHRSGFYQFALDLFYGLQNKNRNFVLQRSRIGYQRGWQDRPWRSDHATLTSGLSDRSGQLYFSFVIGFGVDLKKRP